MTGYLRNCWYLAAWADEVPAGGRLARTILDTPVVIFRSESGTAYALLDRSPHRFVPLGMGHVKGKTITCIYHGLAFDGNGACAANPHGPVLNSMKVPSFPIVEDFFGLWIWMGAGAADRTALPPLGFVNETPSTAFSKGYLRGEGAYQLFADNILDLTHVDYLHPDTLGGGSITRTRAKVTEDAASVTVAWHGQDETPPPVVAKSMPEVGRIDFEQLVEWRAPATLLLSNRTVSTGRPIEEGSLLRNLHIMTPETPTSTHYFFAATRNYALEDAELNQRLASIRYQIFFTEDRPVIEAQQRRLGDNDLWALNPILLRTDEGAIRVRRKLDALIAGEASLDHEPAPSEAAPIGHVRQDEERSRLHPAPLAAMDAELESRP